LGGADVLGLATLLVGLVALAGWTAADLRSWLAGPANSNGASRLPLELFTAGYLLFIAVWIGDRQPRYALPALPGLALAAGAGLAWLGTRSRLQTAAATALLLLMLIPAGVRLFVYERDQVAKMQTTGVQERLAAGRWLASNTPLDTPILADAYSYVPPAFAHVDESFGLTHDMIRLDRPQIIITDASIRDRFRDSRLASRYVDGPDAYNEIAATYDQLESGGLPCYPLLERFGPDTIYGRTSGDPCITGA
jgi:hypothetical protein